MAAQVWSTTSRRLSASSMPRVDCPLHDGTRGRFKPVPATLTRPASPSGSTGRSRPRCAADPRWSTDDRVGSTGADVLGRGPATPDPPYADLPPPLLPSA